jgi:hypothetical protein
MIQLFDDTNKTECINSINGEKMQTLFRDF